MNLGGFNLNFSFRFSSGKGFTFIELIIVIVLLGIITVTMSVKDPGLGAKIAAQTAQVTQDIRYVQSLAMSSRQRVWIFFSTANSTYRITTGACGSGGGGTTVPNPTMGTTNPQLATGISFNTSLTNGCLSFDNQGRPSEGTSTTPYNGDETVRLCPPGGCGGGGGCAGGGCGGGPTTGCTITITENTGYALTTCP